MIEELLEDSDVFTEDLEIEDIVEVENDEVDFIYPCVLLSGVTTQWELEYLSKYTCQENASLPLYVEFEGMTGLVGSMELTSNYLLTLGTISGNTPYKLKILTSPTEEKEIDYKDAETLLKFIKL